MNIDDNKNIDVNMLKKQIQHMEYDRDICTHDIKNQRRMAIVCVAGLALDGVVLYNVVENMRPSAPMRFMFFGAIVVGILAAADLKNRCANIRQSRKSRNDFTRKLEQLNAQYTEIQNMMNKMKNTQNEK